MDGQETSRGVAARERRLARARRMIAARCGPEVARRLAASRPRPDCPAVPTGSLGLDLATGVGGYPRGHLTELVGAEVRQPGVELAKQRVGAGVHFDAGQA